MKKYYKIVEVERVWVIEENSEQIMQYPIYASDTYNILEDAEMAIYDLLKNLGNKDRAYSVQMFYSN